MSLALGVCTAFPIRQTAVCFIFLSTSVVRKLLLTIGSLRPADINITFIFLYFVVELLKQKNVYIFNNKEIELLFTKNQNLYLSFIISMEQKFIFDVSIIKYEGDKKGGTKLFLLPSLT